MRGVDAYSMYPNVAVYTFTTNYLLENINLGNTFD